MNPVPSSIESNGTCDPENSIIIHIGAHRCGSTTVQKSLVTVNPALIKQGRSLRVHGNLDKKRGAGLLRQFRHYRWWKPHWQRLIKEAAEDINHLAPLVVSHESIMGKMVNTSYWHFYKDIEHSCAALALLRKQLNLPLKLLVGTRPLIPLIESIYAFRVISGFQGSLDDFVSNLDLNEFSWQRIKQAFANHNLLDCTEFYELENVTAEMIQKLFSLPIPPEMAIQNPALPVDYFTLWQHMSRLKQVQPKSMKKILCAMPSMLASLYPPPRI